MKERPIIALGLLLGGCTIASGLLRVVSSKNKETVYTRRDLATFYGRGLADGLKAAKLLEESSLEAVRRQAADSSLEVEQASDDETAEDELVGRYSSYTVDACDYDEP